mmetsp:Transcript_21040/g.39402  ORF Transcript_21040/g.39402 Transcript_21040/m.39402 type:complete len:209 (+) Transcript_21040:3033-3659(+)
MRPKNSAPTVTGRTLGTPISTMTHPSSRRSTMSSQSSSLTSGERQLQGHAGRRRKRETKIGRKEGKGKGKGKRSTSLKRAQTKTGKWTRCMKNRRREMGRSESGASAGTRTTRAYCRTQRQLSTRRRRPWEDCWAAGPAEETGWPSRTWKNSSRTPSTSGWNRTKSSKGDNAPSSTEAAARTRAGSGSGTPATTTQARCAGKRTRTEE